MENIFKFIKDPSLVGAYCLKNPERIVAFGYILLMAAQVYTILERIVRKNLENPDEEPVEGLNRQKTKRPTTYAIEYVLSAIFVMRVQKKKYEEWILSKELDKNQKTPVQGWHIDIHQPVLYKIFLAIGSFRI